MPRGDAVQSRPTLEQEMASLKGFTTVNGETVANATDSEEEKQAQLQTDAANATAKAAAKASPVRAMVGADTVAGNDSTAGGDDSAAGGGDNLAGDDDTTMVSMAEVKKMMARAASKRIGEVKKQGRDAVAAERTRSDGLERRLAALEGRSLTKGEPGASDPDVEPKVADFEFGELDAKYIRALARFETRQELKASQSNQQKTNQQAAAEREEAEMVTRRTALEEAGSAKYDDFDEVVTQSRQLDPDDPAFWPCSPDMGKLILASDVGADVAYHLASHPEEARKIFAKSPVEQGAFFARIEAKFTSATDANPKPQPQAGGQQPQVRAPKAPAPPKNQARGSGGTNQASPATTDFKAFEAQAMAANRRR